VVLTNKDYLAVSDENPARLDISSSSIATGSSDIRNPTLANRASQSKEE